ncbi:MAG TPA: hypothetical protein ENN66_06695, partial [Proteobacteria bacterium]|nr:hypothetical protein [Pseudomonadota bacterium]
MKKTGHRLEIFFRNPEFDPRGPLLCARINTLALTNPIAEVRISEVYTLEGEFPRESLQAAAGLLSNPVIHDFLIDEPRALGNADYVLEVGFLPGVTDNVAHTA